MNPGCFYIYRISYLTLFTRKEGNPIRRIIANYSSREFHPRVVAHAIAVQVYHYPHRLSSLAIANYFYQSIV